MGIERGAEIERLLGKILFDIFVLDGRLPTVDPIDARCVDIDSRHQVVLGQKRCDAQSDVARAGYSDAVLFHMP